MPRRSHSLVLVTLLSLAAGAAWADDPATTLPAGRWASQLDGLILEIDANGGFIITPPDPQRPSAQGTWIEADGIVTFRNAIDAAVCPDEPGSYQWALEADRLLFDLVADTCQSRIAHMTEPFVALPEPSAWLLAAAGCLVIAVMIAARSFWRSSPWRSSP